MVIDIVYLCELGGYLDGFLDYLVNFKFDVMICVVCEGDLVFNNELLL